MSRKKYSKIGLLVQIIIPEILIVVCAFLYMLFKFRRGDYFFLDGLEMFLIFVAPAAWLWIAENIL